MEVLHAVLIGGSLAAIACGCTETLDAGANTSDSGGATGISNGEMDPWELLLAIR